MKPHSSSAAARFCAFMAADLNGNREQATRLLYEMIERDGLPQAEADRILRRACLPVSGGTGTERNG